MRLFDYRRNLRLVYYIILLLDAALPQTHDHTTFVSMGIMTRELPVPSIKSGEWNHVFSLRVPCPTDLISHDIFASMMLLPNWTENTLKTFRTVAHANIDKENGTSHNVEIAKSHLLTIISHLPRMVKMVEQDCHDAIEALKDLRNFIEFENCPIINNPNIGVTNNSKDFPIYNQIRQKSGSPSDKSSKYLGEYIVQDESVSASGDIEQDNHGMKSSPHQPPRERRDVHYHYSQVSNSTFNHQHHEYPGCVTPKQNYHDNNPSNGLSPGRSAGPQNPDHETTTVSPKSEVEVISTPLSRKIPQLEILLTPTVPATIPFDNSIDLENMVASGLETLDDDEAFPEVGEMLSNLYRGRVQRAVLHTYKYYLGDVTEDDYAAHLADIESKRAGVVNRMKSSVYNLVKKLNLKMPYSLPTMVYEQLARCLMTKPTNSQTNPNSCVAQLAQYFNEVAHPLPLRRGKRSILPFVGSLYKYMWGTATEEDTHVIQNRLIVMEKEQTKVNQAIETDNDNTRSFMKLSTKMSEDIAKRVNSTMWQIIVDHNAFIKLSNDMATTFSVHMKLSVITTTLVANIASCINYREALSDVHEALRNLIDLYRSFGKMYLSETLDPKVVPTGIISRLKKSAELSLVGTDNTLGASRIRDVYAHNVARVRTFKSTIMIMINIPMTYRITNTTFTEVKSIPIYNNGNWIHLFSNPRIVAIIKTDKLWAEVDPTTYSNCINLQPAICNSITSWNTIRPTDCIPNVALANPTYQRACKLTLYHDTDMHNVYTERISSNRWFVSTNVATFLAKKQCSSPSKDLIIQDVSINLRAEVILPMGCSLSIMDVLLTSQRTSSLITQSYINVNNIAVDTSPLQFEIIDMSNDNSSLPYIQPIFNGNLSNGLGGDILDEGVALEKLLLRKENSSMLFRTAAAKYEYMSRHQINITTTPDVGLSTFLERLLPLTWMKMGFWIICGMLGIFVLLVFCRYCVIPCLSRKRYRSSNLLPYSLAGAAIPMGTTRALMTLVKQAERTDDNFLNNLTEITRQLSHHSQNLDEAILSTRHLNIVLFAIMVFIHLVCTWHITRYLKRIMNDMVSNNGVRNKKGKFILGEIKVKVYVRAAFATWSNNHAYVDEVSYYTSSIPGSIDDWLVTRELNKGRIFQTNQTYRWSSYINTTATWGQICLKHKHHTTLTACEELSGPICLNLRKILIPIMSNLPWNWISVSLVDVTRVLLVTESGSKLVYSYDSNKIDLL